MNLVDIYERHDRHQVLYDLLKEREGRDDINISHRGTPAWNDHVAFVESQPYAAWYLICDGDDPVGTCYLTDYNEIGIWIFSRHHGKGYGKQAVEALMQNHGPRRYLANINPRNEKSRRLWEGLGFTLLQHTYGRDERV